MRRRQMAAKNLKAVSQRGNPSPTAADPLAINPRLYRQISNLLDDLERGDEDISIRERIAALVAIGRLQTIFVGLRKETKDGTGSAGSAVRKYSKAFTHAAGGAKGRPRSAAADEPDDDPFADDGLGGGAA
jgi:hypothetical protein